MASKFSLLTMTVNWRAGEDEAARAGHPVRPVVLAVDDNPLNLELLIEFLQDADCEVIMAASGLDALETAANVLPDLVLLDVMMPGMDGYEVCRRLKANPATRFVPVVLVTSLEQVDDRVRGLEAGADDFMSKPVDQTELLARVRSLFRSNELHDELDDAERVTFALARAVAAKDGGTEAHIERVGAAAHALGKAAGLTGDVLHQLYLGGIIHDIGKIGIPDAILTKPGVLEPWEMEVMRRHVQIGVEIAAGLRSAASVIPIIQHHHEWFDGSGYPHHRSGARIPLVARIVAICDAYDAMISDRPYRRGITPPTARSILRQGAGSQWDPSLVGLFLASDHAPYNHLPGRGSAGKRSYV
jgi:putative two-component system response regulator